MFNMKLKNWIITTLLIAIFVILSVYCTVNLKEVKITLQNLPLYVGAILYGAIPGMLIGGVGMLLNQILTYGFTVTTLFWILPHIIVGGILGYIFENKIVVEFNNFKFLICMISLQILLTVLNTVVMYIDAMIFGYYNFFVILGGFIFRLMTSIISAFFYFCILPYVVNIVKKIH